MRSYSTLEIGMLASYLKRLKERGDPMPVFFVGAGFSASAGIPTAQQMCAEILQEYGEDAAVRALAPEARTYPQVMQALSAADRDRIWKRYVEQARMNLAHLCLAELFRLGYMDYVLTVNFDDLILKALSGVEIFPPVYDLAVLRETPDVVFREKSVVYLHGQHHGPGWLGTPDYAATVQAAMARLMAQMGKDRGWVFIGYSATDPVFDAIEPLLGSFPSVYWAKVIPAYAPEAVENRVIRSSPNHQLLSGYAADGLMLKLMQAMGLELPAVYAKPFSWARDMLARVKPVDEDLLFEGWNRMGALHLRDLEAAVQQYEPDDTLATAQPLNLLKKEVCRLIIQGTLNAERIRPAEIAALESQDTELRNLVSDYYLQWGLRLWNYWEPLSDDERMGQEDAAYAAYARAYELNPAHAPALNMMCFISYMILLDAPQHAPSGWDADTYARQLLEIAEKCSSSIVQFGPDPDMLTLWGDILRNVAVYTRPEQRAYYLESAALKYEEAVRLDPGQGMAWVSWADVRMRLAEAKQGAEAREYYLRAYETTRKVLSFTERRKEGFLMRSKILYRLYTLQDDRQDTTHLIESLDILEKLETESPGHFPYDAEMTWGHVLCLLGDLRTGAAARPLYASALEKYRKALRFSDLLVNECLPAGNCCVKLARLSAGAEALALYQEASRMYARAAGGADPFHACVEWGQVLAILAERDVAGDAMAYRGMAFAAFQQARTYGALPESLAGVWGAVIKQLSAGKTGYERTEMLHQALDQFQIVYDQKGHAYGLACTCALLGMSTAALRYLSICLQNKEIPLSLITTDPDWNSLRDHPDLQSLLEKYKD